MNGIGGREEGGKCQDKLGGVVQGSGRDLESAGFVERGTRVL